jgi:hypothetical protein
MIVARDISGTEYGFLRCRNANWYELIGVYSEVSFVKEAAWSCYEDAPLDSRGTRS